MRALLLALVLAAVSATTSRSPSVRSVPWRTRPSARAIVGLKPKRSRIVTSSDRNSMNSSVCPSWRTRSSTPHAPAIARTRPNRHGHADLHRGEDSVLEVVQVRRILEPAAAAMATAVHGLVRTYSSVVSTATLAPSVTVCWMSPSLN